MYAKLSTMIKYYEETTLGMDLSARLLIPIKNSQKKRSEIREVLCYPRMLDMKENFYVYNKLDERLLRVSCKRIWYN